MKRTGHCGIKNLGNTCFLNSILQLILHCRPIIDFLVAKKRYKYARDQFGNVMMDDSGTPIKKLVNEGEYTDYLELVIKKKNPTFTDEQVTKEINKSLTTALASVIDDVFINGNGVVEPIKLKWVLGEKVPRFKGFKQEDSQEAILMILDTIYEETGYESTTIVRNIPEIIEEYNKRQAKHVKTVENFKEKTKEYSKDDEEFVALMDSVEKYIKDHRKYKNNFYSNPYNVNLLKQYEGSNYVCTYFSKMFNPIISETCIFTISTVKCACCNTESNKYEHCKMLDIYVKETLGEALQDYVKTETISDYMCDTCGVKRDVTKTMKIWQNPRIMFIHIKKFIQTFRGNRVFLEKDETNMDLPHTLDITNYCEKKPNIQDSSKKYELIGISNHSGGLNGGHYTADCRCILKKEAEWYNYNDSSFKIYLKEDIENINTLNAYVAMYERIDE